MATQVRGIELSSETYRSTRNSFDGVDNAPQLIHGDFFDQSPRQFGKVTAIVGNPPFIRYQRFSGEVRQKALRRASEAGVELSELCSSWAPFLVHATTFIEPDGRMAVVAPAELVHAGCQACRPIPDIIVRTSAVDSVRKETVFRSG